MSIPPQVGFGQCLIMGTEIKVGMKLVPKNGCYCNGLDHAAWGRIVKHLELQAGKGAKCLEFSMLIVSGSMENNKADRNASDRGLGSSKGK